MTAHLRYLKYVVLHKLYVLRAGLAIRKHVGIEVNMLAWLWRLLVHDLSKFGRAEWGPYVAMFYGEKAEVIAERRGTAWKTLSEDSHGPMSPEAEAGHREGIRRLVADITRDRKAAFNAAWLHHIHANPHHWQHHILHEDSGKTIVLVPPAVLVWEMVADWLAAGPKALRAHSMAEAVAETIVWYAANHRQMMMREHPKAMAEFILTALAEHYGIASAAKEIESAARTRVSITIPGR